MMIVGLTVRLVKINGKYIAHKWVEKNIPSDHQIYKDIFTITLMINDSHDSADISFLELEELASKIARQMNIYEVLNFDSEILSPNTPLTQ